MRRNPSYTGSVMFKVCALAFLALFLCFCPCRAEKVETPESYTARKISSYKAGLQALIAEYNKWCLAGGKPIEFVPAPGGMPGGVPGGVPGGQVPGGVPGGEGFVQTPGLGGQLPVENVEIEQVINTWYASSSGSTANPFSWADVTGIFRSGSSSSSTSSSSSPPSPPSPPPAGGDNCTGRSVAIGGTMYIILDNAAKTCSLSTSSSSGGVLAGAYVTATAPAIYMFKPFTAHGWTGLAGSDTYDTYSTASFSKGGSTATITFTVTAVPHFLKVSGITWH